MMAPPSEKCEASTRAGCPIGRAELDALCKLSAAVFGNGKPETSMLTRMAIVEKRTSLIVRILLVTGAGVWGLVTRTVFIWLEGLLSAAK